MHVLGKRYTDVRGVRLARSAALRVFEDVPFLSSGYTVSDALVKGLDPTQSMTECRDSFHRDHFICPLVHLQCGLQQVNQFLVLRYFL